MGAGSRTVAEELPSLIHLRIAVLATLSDWMRVGGGAQDILDDAELHAAMNSFLHSSVDHHLPTAQSDYTNARSALEQLSKSRRGFERTFDAQTRRPSVRSDTVGETAPLGDLGRELPNIDSLTSEELVNHLDAMATAASSIVVDEVCLLIYLSPCYLILGRY